MLGLITFFVSLASFVAAQQTSFKPGTGVRSLWIPFKTVTGTPVASIYTNEPTNNVTVYVVSCPTAQANCAIAPNLTVTEGDSTVKYTTTNTNGVAVLGCKFTDTVSATCSQQQSGGDNIYKTTTVIGQDQIKYQAIDVTSTMNSTATGPTTVTVTQSAESTSSSSTDTSTGAAQTQASGPWAMGGALGAGVLALAAL